MLKACQESLVSSTPEVECAHWFAEGEVCRENWATLFFAAQLHLYHLFVQSLHLFHLVWMDGVPLYSPFAYLQAVSHLVNCHLRLYVTEIF